MDISREADLYTLMEVMNDSKRPLWTRRTAFLAFGRVRQQIRDRQLTSLRRRYVAAQAASDAHESEKLAEVLREYQGRVYGR